MLCAMPMTEITAQEFAQRTNLTARAARGAFRKCASGGYWRGHRLPVRTVTNSRGGQSGTVYTLQLDLCPPDLRALLDGSTSAPSTCLEQDNHDTLNIAQIAIARDRQAIIAPILNTMPGSTERGKAYREIAAKPVHRLGDGYKAVSERTLMEWVANTEARGAAALLPKARADRGRARVQITRAWDQAVGLDEPTRARIAVKIEKLAKSMVANDGVSIREVLRLCGERLAHASAEAGSPLSGHELRKICTLNVKWAKRIGLDRFRLVYLHDKDHKTWQDKADPRIRRHLLDTPMELLIGDVHYADLLVEEDGKPIRVRLITWMDAASMFAWVTPVFLSPGMGITQEDIAEALSQVVLCPHGGIPQELYLDNGSEYSEIASTVMIRLGNLAQADFRVTLAKPYSPTSKGEIEGFFNVLEGIFKGLPGWIGGDRTNKKSANKGQVVAPYRHGIAALQADIQAAVAIYNDRPQSGRLQGLSPVQMLEQKIAQTGFSARVPSEEAYDLIFSKPVSRVLRQGMINLDNRQWYTSALADLPLGARVDVLVPLRSNRERVFVRYGGENLGWAEPEEIFQHGDRRGARRQAELEAGRKNAVRKLKSRVDPTVSTFELQKMAVRQIAPLTNAPEGWEMGAIDKTKLQSPRDLEEREDAERRALLDEFLALNRPKERGAAGATASPSCANP